MSPPRLRPRTASTARLTSSKTSARASDSASFRGKSIGGIHAAVPLKGLLTPGSAGDDGQEVETLEPEEEVRRVREAEEGGGHVHGAPDADGAPAGDRVADPEAEEDHPQDDADAEHADAAKEAEEGRHAQGRDEEDKELVVAREPMDDADPEHGPVFRETGEVDVGVLEVPGFVAVEVAVKDPELEEEAEDADPDEADPAEELHVGPEIPKGGLPEREQDACDEARRAHVALGTAQAHEGRLPEVPAPGQEVRNGDGRGRGVAVL